MPTQNEGGRRSIQEFLTSETIVLEATDSDTSFNVHEGLLCSISPALSAACSREWKESASRRYKFREDVTEQMLLCFLAWAYHGDYHSGNGDKIMPSSSKTTAETNDLEDISGSATSKGNKNSKRKQKSAKGSASKLCLPEEVPVECREELKAEKGSLEDTSLSVISATIEDSVAHPLLLHAKLYVFANMYLIEPLKASAMQKIIDQLQQFGSLSDGDERVAVFDIFAYTFSRLSEKDPLLHWLARYASWTLQELRQMPTRFDDLLSEDSNFAKLLLRYVSKSTVNPFSLKAEDIMPRYPLSIARAHYGF